MKTELTIESAEATVKLLLENPATVIGGITAAINLCHGAAVASKWWHSISLVGLPNIVGDHDEEFTPKDLNVGERLMLIVSEVAEAMEGHRKNLMDDHLPHRKMVEVELADAIIRIFDLAGAMKLDLGQALVEKVNYNRTRLDHKPENRAKEGGKGY